jgi:hypothetical protein
MIDKEHSKKTVHTKMVLATRVDFMYSSNRAVSLSLKSKWRGFWSEIFHTATGVCVMPLNLCLEKEELSLCNYSLVFKV